MDYWKLVKRAWDIIKKHKFLWFFGLFLGGFSFSSGSSFNEGVDNYSRSIDKRQAADIFEKTYDFLFGNLVIIGIIFLTILLLFLLIVFLKTVSQGAIIAAVNKIEKKEKINFSQSFKLGIKYFWKVLVLNIIFGSILFISLILLATPIVFLFVLEMILRGLALMLLALAIFIPLAVIIGFTSVYALRFTVIKNKGAFESIKYGFHLFKNNLAPSFIIYFILLAINIIITIISVISIIFLIIIIGIPLFIIGMLIYPVLGIIGAILLIILGILIFIVIASFINMLVNSYKSTLWTLIFRELM